MSSLRPVNVIQSLQRNVQMLFVRFSVNERFLLPVMASLLSFGMQMTSLRSERTQDFDGLTPSHVRIHLNPLSSPWMGNIMDC